MNKNRTCSIADCERSGQTRRGWCVMHYYRWSRDGDDFDRSLDSLNGVAKETCSIADCDRGGEITRGWCSMHYLRWKRHGEDFDRSPDLRKAKDGTLKAFVDQATASNTDNCIIWPYTTAAGYGQISIKGKIQLTHRYVLEQVSGPPPTDKHHAAHAPGVCHNPACINPKHLRWATRAENAADKLIDGTDNRGEKHGNSKLTEPQVLEIYKRAHDGENQRLLGEEFETAKQTISQIKTGHRWSWLTGQLTSRAETPVNP